MLQYGSLDRQVTNLRDDSIESKLVDKIGDFYYAKEIEQLQIKSPN